MKAISCPQEALVADSVRTGCWDSSTREHLEGCSYCRELVQIMGCMKSISSAEEKFLPDAERIWLNARMIAIQEAQARVLHPLAIAAFLGRTAFMLALTAGIIWCWFGFQSLAAGSLPGNFPMPQSFIAAGAALATCAVAFLFVKLSQPLLE
ncbi:MAG: hypothetical protein JXA73_02555 [Acidobacteria bacterium]|nr:hypothetical protein [Acidobacteriota bacterium]